MIKQRWTNGVVVSIWFYDQQTSEQYYFWILLHNQVNAISDFAQFIMNIQLEWKKLNFEHFPGTGTILHDCWHLAHCIFNSAFISKSLDD